MILRCAIVGDKLHQSYAIIDIIDIWSRKNDVIIIVSVVDKSNYECYCLKNIGNGKSQESSSEVTIVFHLIPL